MDKKNLNEYELERNIRIERLAFYIYDYLERKKHKVYADKISRYFCSLYLSDDKINFLIDTAEILKNDYDIDLLSLKFQDENIKIKVQKGILENELLEYFEKNGSNSLKDYSDDKFVKDTLNKIKELELLVQGKEDINISI